MSLLPSISAEAFDTRSSRFVDRETMARVAEIVEDVRANRDPALRRYARLLGDLADGEPMVHPREDLHAALRRLEPRVRATLERTHQRIERFAAAQLECLSELTTPLDGGQAGHRAIPIERVAAYAPGGRHPLPSSVLMTVTPARVAGVREVTVASPRPAEVTLAAAAVAGADRLVAVGGAQVIAAFAYGTETVPACDLIVGPGNRWVTAAKKLVYGDVGVDMLAGPSELVVLADDEADPGMLAADLIAQAEHDVDARPFLVTTSPTLGDAVRLELEAQLATLPTAGTARVALASGGCLLAASLDEALAICDRLAPEHLELMIRDPLGAVDRLRHYGSLFVGEQSAEVFGDYGVGPNHVLPTGRCARFAGGLSVFTFLRIATWMHIEHGHRPHRGRGGARAGGRPGGPRPRGGAQARRTDWLLRGPAASAGPRGTAEASRVMLACTPREGKPRRLRAVQIGHRQLDPVSVVV